MDVMTIGVFDEELRIGLLEGVSIEQAEEISFDITIPEISSIKLVGVGDYILSGDDQDELTIFITGVGNVKAFDVEVRICNIIFTGVGDCEVNVRDSLTIDIYGVGNVYYIGNPAISSTISGVGALINAN
jgi:hypothetical protein